MSFSWIKSKYSFVLHPHFSEVHRETLKAAQIFTKKRTYQYVYDEVRFCIYYAIENIIQYYKSEGNKNIYKSYVFLENILNAFF